MKKKNKELIPKYEVDIFWSPEDNCYVARVPELEGCTTHGETIEEAAKMAKEAILGYVETLRAKGITPPTPLSEKRYSGDFLVRTTPELHRDLAVKAAMHKTSFNKYVTKLLKKAV